MNPYAIPSLVAALFSVCLGVYVLRKDPTEPLNRVFSLLMFICAIWSFGEFGSRISSEPSQALMWIKILNTAVPFLGPAALHFVLVFTKQEKVLRRKMVGPILYGISIVFVFFVWGTDLFVKGVTRMPWGLFDVRGPMFPVQSMYITICVLITLILMVHSYSRTVVPFEKRRKLCVVVGGFVAAIGGIGVNLVPPIFLGFEIVPLATLFFAFVGVFFAYAIVKYKLFVLPPISRLFIPAPEAKLRTKLKYKLKEGRSYLIEEKEPERGPKIFREQVMHDVPGLWLTTLHPNKIRERYGLARSPILYLTPERVVGEAAAPPDRPDKAIGVISSYFFARPQKSVVFVDCFKELIVANGFEKTLDFLSKLGKLCSENNSNLIIQIDPSKFEKKQLAAVEKVLARA